MDFMTVYLGLAVFAVVFPVACKIADYIVDKFIWGVTMFLSSFQSFIVISHAKHLLRKYGTMRAASYLHKNNVCFTVALHLILGN